MDAEKFIAFVSSKESIVAKKFAFMMGKADENAIHRPACIEEESSIGGAPSAWKGNAIFEIRYFFAYEM